jgi:hypothetical protein
VNSSWINDEQSFPIANKTLHAWHNSALLIGNQKKRGDLKATARVQARAAQNLRM